MAEYKTYKCDSCNGTNAIHLEFEYMYDCGSGVVELDICSDCLVKKFTKVMNLLNNNDRMKIYKGFLEKF